MRLEKYVAMQTQKSEVWLIDREKEGAKEDFKEQMKQIERWVESVFRRLEKKGRIGKYTEYITSHTVERMIAILKDVLDELDTAVL